MDFGSLGDIFGACWPGIVRFSNCSSLKPLLGGLPLNRAAHFGNMARLLSQHAPVQSLFCGELTGLGVERAHHDKGSFTWGSLNSAFGIVVKLADPCFLVHKALKRMKGVRIPGP